MLFLWLYKLLLKTVFSTKTKSKVFNTLYTLKTLEKVVEKTTERKNFYFEGASRNQLAEIEYNIITGN